MTQRNAWDRGDDRPAVPWSKLDPRDRAAMQARLDIVMAELRSAVPDNERLRRQSTPPAASPFASREETV